MKHKLANTEYEQLEQRLRARRFRYWCFIGWAAGSSELIKFVHNLHDSLHNEFADLFEFRDIFLDRTELRIGDDWGRKLGETLSQSVCLVSVCTPLYFASSHPYCGREWAGMEELSDRRFGEAGPPSILPVVFRAHEQMPQRCRRLQYGDFSRIALQRRDAHNAPEFRMLVQEIVKTSIDIGKKLATLPSATLAPPLGSPPYSLPSRSAFAAMPPSRPRLPFQKNKKERNHP
jgi:hypothetical protein